MRNSWCRRTGPILLLLVLAGCAAESLHRQGISAMDAGEYESGLALLNKAAHADPHNMSYRFDYATRRAAAVLGLLNIADSA
ncbi:MAG: secretion type II protein, partial [Gammaproteobacteria bacterium]|nr:secretion type II protein [Gammaproteobacteria bacterium]